MLEIKCDNILLIFLYKTSYDCSIKVAEFQIHYCVCQLRLLCVVRPLICHLL